MSVQIHSKLPEGCTNITGLHTSSITGSRINFIPGKNVDSSETDNSDDCDRSVVVVMVMVMMVVVVVVMMMVVVV